MRPLLTLLKIVAVSAPLTWLWIAWGREAYAKLFVQLALPIYGLFGLTSLLPNAARDRFINYLPFLILMLITPRLTLRRRVVGIGVGFIVIFLVHVIFIYVASIAENLDNTINVRGFRKIVPANGLSDSVPFILWVIIARDFVWESAGRVFSPQAGEAPRKDRWDKRRRLMKSQNLILVAKLLVTVTWLAAAAAFLFPAASTFGQLGRLLFFVLLGVHARRVRGVLRHPEADGAPAGPRARANPGLRRRPLHRGKGARGRPQRRLRRRSGDARVSAPALRYPESSPNAVPPLHLGYVAAVVRQCASRVFHRRSSPGGRRPDASLKLRIERSRGIRASDASRMTVAVLAEKPSVARDIARVLGATRRGDGVLVGNGYAVTWALGHLVALAEPQQMRPQWKRWQLRELPMIPESWPLEVTRETRDRFQIVSRLLLDPDVEEVVCATDAGREGELIFRYIYEAAGAVKPVKRLWVSSLTEDAIREGFANLRDATHYDGLADAARGRSRADWLVGMNLSRAYTLTGGETFSVGRVQTPTLAMLVERALASPPLRRGALSGSGGALPAGR